ncbi:MAG: DinB family protein [Anaerolineales bacterium]|nr:DinB family protein [Anaerolineales bacterium]
MDTFWRTTIWQQFEAAIAALEEAMHVCPDDLWNDRSQPLEFWYVTYHTLFWLDLYLSGSVEGFTPPDPFTLDELDPAGLLPERPYTKDELQRYLDHCRRKCRATLEALTDEKARQRCNFSWTEFSFAELLLYNMRHVQEHAAQLNLILGEETGSAPGWVAREKSSLDSN